MGEEGSRQSVRIKGALPPAPLRKAISRGLQLAIFNSCDGLGLANDLAELNIPQIIVMRSPVPDLVAQEFLKHFLKAFSGVETRNFGEISRLYIWRCGRRGSGCQR